MEGCGRLTFGQRLSAFDSEMPPRVFSFQLVFVLDPDEEKQYLDKIQHRTKEKSYAFDKAFSVEASNKVCLQIFVRRVGGPILTHLTNVQEVYDQSVKPLIQGISQGLSSTVGLVLSFSVLSLGCSVNFYVCLTVAGFCLRSHGKVLSCLFGKMFSLVLI